MTLRGRLVILSITTVAVIVALMASLHLDSLTRTWIGNAVENSNVAGREIQSLLVMRISEASTRIPPDHPLTLAETKENWRNIVADDPGVDSALVERTAVRSGIIVEINIIGEDGKVLASSVPSREGQAAPVRPNISTLRNAGPLDRFNALMGSHTDYQSIVPLGIPQPPTPVFQIQTLVSAALVRDQILPELRRTGIVSLLALLAAVALAAVSAQLALRPMRSIGKAIDTLATGNPLGLNFTSQDREYREVSAIESKLTLLGEQMQGAMRDADDLRGALGRLARGMAHEIKNPLNAIALRLEMLRMRISEEIPEAEPEIDLLSNEVRRLDRVVKTFLDLNRPVELDIHEFDPAELAAGVLEIMQPAAAQAGIEMTVVRPETSFTVAADRGLLEQGVLNLVNNAIQATAQDAERPSGEHRIVRVSISRTANNCEIAVTDNGPGMPPSVRDHIFEPYYTTKATGSGIGLALTKRAMELHRGAITVETAPGRGATFVLSFPVACPPQAIRSAGA